MVDVRFVWPGAALSPPCPWLSVPLANTLGWAALLGVCWGGVPICPFPYHQSQAVRQGYACLKGVVGEASVAMWMLEARSPGRQ